MNYEICEISSEFIDSIFNGETIMKEYAIKYGVPFAIALAAVWAANNVPAVKKAVGPKSS